MTARGTDAEEEVVPRPEQLVESLRDFGYTLPTALADLVDNSITAGATRVSVEIDARGDQSIVCVVDNGFGMSRATLVEAMRMGSGGPTAVRSG